MRIGKAVLVAAAFIGISAGSASAVPAFVAEEVELRWGPDEEFPAQVIVPEGTEVEVQECSELWCRVGYEEYEGFLPSEVLNILSPAPAPFVQAFPDYEFNDDGYVYGPGFAFPRFGGLHSRRESRVSIHSRGESRARFHSRNESGVRFHSRGESAGRAHGRAFSGQTHSRFSSRGPRNPDVRRPRQDFQPSIRQPAQPRPDLRDRDRPRQRQDLQRQDLQQRNLQRRDLQRRDLQRQPDGPRRDLRDRDRPRPDLQQRNLQRRDLQRQPDGPRRDLQNRPPRQDAQPRNIQRPQVQPQQRAVPQQRSAPPQRAPARAPAQKKRDDR